MGLLDKKSTSDLQLYYDQYIRSLLLDNDDTKKVNLAYDRDVFINRCGIVPYVRFSINKLLELDLFSDVNMSNREHLNINIIRSFLFELGLLNEYDRELLLSIGFPEDDMYKSISYLDINRREYNLLTRSCFKYIWELLLIPEKRIKGISLCGDVSSKHLVDSVYRAGYSFIDSNTMCSNKNNDISDNNVYKILNTRTRYVQIINEYNNKISLLDKQLEEEVKKLIRTNNNC